MFFLYLITFILLSCNSFDLLNFQPTWTENLHALCLNSVPASPYFELYGAIVCGEALKNPQFAMLFQQTGLIHILVVSGSHLILISKFNSWKALEIPILLAYSAMVGLQPPVVRSLLQILIQKLLTRYGVKHTAWNVVFLSGLVTWSLQASWISSLSFQLSWFCALILSITQGRSLLFRSTAIYLCTSIILCQFQWPHPVGILMNIFVAPLMGVVLFPISALSLLIHSLAPAVDWIWFLLLKLCECISSGIIMFPRQPSNLLYIWMVIWFLHFYVHLRSVLEPRP